MNKLSQSELLKDKRVVEEINRHLWIESEKAGFNIGFDKAKEDWLRNFSKAWMDYHLPKQRRRPAKTIFSNFLSPKFSSKLSSIKIKPTKVQV